MPRRCLCHKVYERIEIDTDNVLTNYGDETMLPIKYFKRQAKNLLQDQRTRVWNEQEGFYDYSPRFFDVDQILFSLRLRDDEEPVLQRTQHIIAKIAGFDEWSDLINCDPEELAFRKLVFENQNYLWWGEWVLRYRSVMDSLNTSEGEMDIESQMHLYQQWLTGNKDSGFDLEGTGFLLEQKQ